jgi:hypothetical protein
MSLNFVRFHEILFQTDAESFSEGFGRRHTQKGIGSQIWLHLVFSACLLPVNPQLESLSFQKGWTVCFQNGVKY